MTTNIQAPPVCDIDPSHGPMQAEPMYKQLEPEPIILQHGWFCQVEDCDGYGGPVLHMKREVKKLVEEAEQLELFA